MSIRSNLDKKIVEIENMDSKYQYVDIDDVSEVLNHIEDTINKCIKLFKVDTLTDCLYELEQLAQELF